jgi:hypothetical protein
MRIVLPSLWAMPLTDWKGGGQIFCQYTNKLPQICARPERSPGVRRLRSPSGGKGPLAIALHGGFIHWCVCCVKHL